MYTYYRYLVINEKTGERRTVLVKKGGRVSDKLKPGEKVAGTIGGTYISQRQGEA